MDQVTIPTNEWPNMLQLLAILAPIALIDSSSVTPLSLVPLASMLAGRNPYRTAFAFLGGLFVSYWAMGLAFVFGLSAVFMRLNAWLSHRWNNPEPADFMLEVFLGLVLLFFGMRIALKRQAKTREREAPQNMSVASAFGFGVMINVVGFPGALPYFAAADQILRADPPPLMIALAVTYYVVLFILPLTTIVLIRALAGAKGDALMAAVKSFFDKWGRRVLMVALVVLGALMVVDGVTYLMGRPIFPVG